MGIAPDRKSAHYLSSRSRLYRDHTLRAKSFERLYTRSGFSSSSTMTDIEPPSLSPQSESYPEEVSYPSDAPSSTSSNSSTSVVTFYKPPTILSLIRTAAINLILPFINGVMLGFGEIFAHELAFRWGWRGAKVYFKHCGDNRLMAGISITKVSWTRS